MGGIVEEISASLAGALAGALESARSSGAVKVEQVPDFTVEVPREKDHGDFAANLAMLLAKPARMAPRKIAEMLVNNFSLTGTWVERVEIAGPGFINFYLKPAWVYEILPRIIAQRENYGRVDEGKGKRVQVEFVSANPTGLLHMGNARGAALGDSIASILDFAGFSVTREFYINDAGNQIENFGTSLEARYMQLLGMDVPFPEEGYHGEDLIGTVRGFVDRNGDAYLKAEAGERRAALVKYALNEKLEAIKRALEDFGVRYDVWFSERFLHESGAVGDTLKLLREQGHIYEHEEALWFKASAFGAEKDEVLVRSNGIPTYFATDIAYHLNKFQRGFERVIDIWGADHHGHVARMKGAVAALGCDPEALEVVIMQLVRLYKGGELVRMSKRSGQFVTLEELMEEVGKDAARYFFVMRSSDSHLDFDLDLARAETNENPVYYIQYAHARICSILRQCKEQGGKVPDPAEVDFNLLQEESEFALARKLADFPGEVASAAKGLAPQRIARYAHELAGLLHSFYNAHRVITADQALSGARLVLVDATRITLQNALHLLGLAAPERM
ncbi:arginine--tRNA ligase [Pelotomaculum terephthalicicum JT]|uniref:arginine--tRNA ligase n=1 Tax=Pelotomaculum TaxID=191373 RepID=UPI0009C81D04|nr:MULTISPECIES: arginine--tRNA ligase [Pelotomaculum]MCG9967898.1 arginine--tRNA ligase [Pelotomaculum terephthalicicum JT]OPX90972.1 MAG: Arginine--tRNA ligase [Pelotomaculum sp. PtaB.Bin117]OPY62475.1 MAG: Arginine--tRNA ligase [Pelotomaculum sp. PtaU1.Bin065]